MMKSKPIIIIFLLAMFCVSWIQFVLDVRSSNLKGFEILMVKRERSVRALESVASSLVATGRADVVEGHLNDAMKVGWIDFYMMTSGNDVVMFNSVRPLSDATYSTLAQMHPPGSFWEFRSGEVADGDEFKFLEADVGSDRSRPRRLKIGFSTNRETFLAEMKAYRADENRRVFVLSLVIACAVFLFSARDILKVAKILRTKGVKGLKEIRVMSREAASLQSGLAGYGETVNRLSIENKKLSGQVLPSLRSELESGISPPYDFNCTMVRTDINDFTKIFHSHPTEPFLQTIDAFFKSCSHLISRYHGYIHEFVGDEIIFYFKDADHLNSFAAALACCQEIGVVAAKFDAKTSIESGYRFRVKSSVSHGKLRFGPLLNGFSLAGAPLIETTRILSAVSERSENTIHFDASNLFRLDSTFEFSESFRANLKGMDGERRILKLDRQKPVERWSEIATSGDAKFKSRSDLIPLWSYRSDSSLKFLLNVIAENSSRQFAAEATRLLANTVVTDCDPTLSEAVLSTIWILNGKTREVREGASSDDARALSSLMISLPKLLPRGSYKMISSDFLRELLENPDPRVQANTIEAALRMRESGVFAFKLDDGLLDSPNQRVAANALIYFGTDKISKAVVRQLKKGFLSTDRDLLAATIFAWGEIARSHFATDIVYLRTQSDFFDLLSKIRAIVQRHPDLAEIAAMAALKAGESRLSEELAQRSCAA